MIDWALVAARIENLELPAVYNGGDVSLNLEPVPPPLDMLWQYEGLWEPVGSANAQASQEQWDRQHQGRHLVAFLEFAFGEPIVWDAGLHNTMAQHGTLASWLEAISGQSMPQLETLYAQFLQSQDGQTAEAVADR